MTTKYLAAYALVALKKDAPTSDDVSAVLKSVNVPVDKDTLDMVMDAVKGKSIADLIAEGNKAFSCSQSAAAAPAAGAAAPAAKKPEAAKAPAPKPDDDDDDDGATFRSFFLVGGGLNYKEDAVEAKEDQQQSAEKYFVRSILQQPRSSSRSTTASLAPTSSTHNTSRQTSASSLLVRNQRKLLSPYIPTARGSHLITEKKIINSSWPLSSSSDSSQQNQLYRRNRDIYTSITPIITANRSCSSPFTGNYQRTKCGGCAVDTSLYLANTSNHYTSKLLQQKQHNTPIVYLDQFLYTSLRQRKKETAIMDVSKGNSCDLMLPQTIDENGENKKYSKVPPITKLPIIPIKTPRHHEENNNTVNTTCEQNTRNSGRKINSDNMNNLREHIIHLVQSADDDIMVKMVKILESGEFNTTNNSGMGSKHQKSEDGYLSSNVTMSVNDVASDHLTNISGGGYQCIDQGSEAAMGQVDSDDNEDYSVTVTDETYTPRDGLGRGGRRIGVSAVPMSLASPKTFVPRVIPKTKEHMEMVTKTVGGCHLFANMDDKEQEVIVNALEKDAFSAGEVILTQGVIPNPAKFYLLFEGICEVIKGGKHVATLTTGNTFGELEIMYNTECAATIRCVTPCTLYSLDQESYRNIVYKVSMEKKEKYLKLVENVSFLEPLSGYDKKTLAEALVTANYYTGDHIIKFGEKGNYMHIIVEGEVQVVGREKGKKVNVIKLGPGDVFGELELLFNHLTMADVVAATKKVQTAKISRKHFNMCVGMLDELKHYVAKKGNYEFYLREADQSVLNEIASLHRRVKLVDDGSQYTDLTISDLGEGGEVIIPHMIDFPGGRKKRISYRYPLRPLKSSSLLIIGIREDATIVLWSEAMERVTNFTSSEVIGQSLYTFMHSEEEQNSLYNSISHANKFAGHIDDYYYSETKSNIYTIQRRDGLTRVRLKLSLVPPIVSHGNNIAEILLAVGCEEKIVPPAANNDHSSWLVEQIKMSIIGEGNDCDKMLQISNILKKFENLQRNAINPATNENVTIVNVRQLIGQVVMDYAQECMLNHSVVTQNFDKFFFDEIYCDAKLLPNCLSYAMSNCARLKDCQLKIDVCVVDDYGMELLQISFLDDGPGFPQKVLDSLGRNSPQGDAPQPTICQVANALEKQGGKLTVVSRPGNTCVNFLIPFNPNEQEKDIEMGSISGSKYFLNNKVFTTLVVEDDCVHRNLMCAVLWEKKHAVLPGYTWADIERVKDITDILMVDTSQSAMSDPSLMIDTITLLREKARTMSIILTCENVDDETKKAALQAGFLTLPKPCTRVQILQVLRKAEDKVVKLKAEKEKIEATRSAFNQNSRGAWKKGALLGKGSFGEVYEAIDVLTGGKMAVKYLRVSKETSTEVRQEIINEIEIMCTLQHPNIIHYFFAEDDVENEVIKVVMEFASGGTLQDLLQSKGTLDYPDYVALLRDVVEGVAYIHGQRYVHRDLKTPNVLLNSSVKGKLGDFGTAKRLEEGEQLYDMVGTLHYMAPEVLSAGEIVPHDPDAVQLQPGEDYDESQGTKIGYSFPADIWSLGCIALEMATNKPPFSHLGCMNSLASITKFLTQLQDVPDLSPLFSKPPEVIEFVSACLNPDPKKRPTANTLLSYSIFQDSSSEEMKTAMKALKRAQLMTVLNAFVAFQEISELQAKKNEARAKKRKSLFQRGSDNIEDNEYLNNQESTCFDYTSASDAEEKCLDPRKQESDFFADSNYDEESEDERSQNSQEDNTNSELDNIDNDYKRGSGEVVTTTGPTIVDNPFDGMVELSVDNPSTRIHYFGGIRADEPGENDSDHIRISKQSNPTISTPSLPGNSFKSATNIMDSCPASPLAFADSDKFVICLHEALMVLVDQVRNIDETAPMEDALKKQYQNVRENISCDSQSFESFVDGVEWERRKRNVTFRPNIEQLLQADTEIIRIIAKSLSTTKN